MIPAIRITIDECQAGVDPIIGFLLFDNENVRESYKEKWKKNRDEHCEKIHESSSLIRYESEKYLYTLEYENHEIFSEDDLNSIYI